MKKFRLSNPPRYWTGATMIGLEVLVALVYLLVTMSWNWLTIGLLAFAAVVLYNTLATILVWNGSKKAE